MVWEGGITERGGTGNWVQRIYWAIFGRCAARASEWPYGTHEEQCIRRTGHRGEHISCDLSPGGLLLTRLVWTDGERFPRTVFL